MTRWRLRIQFFGQKLNAATASTSGIRLKMNYPDIEEWIMNELYAELLKMPLWTVSAFEKDGKFYFDEIRLRLLTQFISSYCKKYPHENTENTKEVSNYIYEFKTEKYIPLLRQVWGISYQNYGPIF